MKLHVQWLRDPSASGWRSRAFLPDGWELLAYDDGRWEIRCASIFSGWTIGQGIEKGDPRAAKKRAIKVYKAMIA